MFDNEDDDDVLNEWQADVTDYTLHNHPMEYIILSNIIKDEKYRNKCFAKIQGEYFEDQDLGNLYRHFRSFTQEQDFIPPPDALDLYLKKKDCVRPKDVMKQYLEILNNKTAVFSDKWLLDETQSWVTQRSVLDAIARCYEAHQNQNKEIPMEMFPTIMEEAVAVNFTDDEIVHAHNHDSMYNMLVSMAQEKNKLPFRLKTLNRLTNGGVLKGTLNIIAMITGGGKSIFMEDIAIGYSNAGYNVLYVTYELSVEQIYSRYYSNMCDIDNDELMYNLKHKQEETIKRIMATEQSLRKGYFGVVRLCEGIDSALVIERHVKDLKLNHGIVLDVIVVDHLKNMSSYLSHKNAMEHTRLGKIATELSNLANKTDTAVWTGMQLIRGADEKETISKADIAESYAVIHTCSLLMSGNPNQEMGGFMMRMLKNRYGKPFNEEFVIGHKLGHYKLYDKDQVGLTTERNSDNSYKVAFERDAKPRNVNIIERIKL